MQDRIGPLFGWADAFNLRRDRRPAQGCDKGKTGESRRRKATRLPSAQQVQRGPRQSGRRTDAGGHMRAANTRPTLALMVALAGILGGFSTYGCFSGRSLTDPGNSNPGTGFRPPTSQVAAVVLSPSSIAGKP